MHVVHMIAYACMVLHGHSAQIFLSKLFFHKAPIPMPRIKQLSAEEAQKIAHPEPAEGW